MTDRWQVRAATLADLDTIVGFNCAMARETEQRELDRDTVRLGVTRLLTTPTLGRTLVVTDGDGNVAGTLSVTSEWSDWRNGQFWWIQSVYVEPAFRRQGAFAALYRHLEREARTTPDVCGLRLYVERDNTAAQATYLGLGMAETHYKLFEVDFSGT